MSAPKDLNRGNAFAAADDSARRIAEDATLMLLPAAGVRAGV